MGFELGLLRKRVRPDQIAPTPEPAPQAPKLRAIDRYGRMITILAAGEFTPASAEIARAKALEHAREIAQAPEKERRQVYEALGDLIEQQSRTGRVTAIPGMLEELLAEGSTLA